VQAPSALPCVTAGATYARAWPARSIRPAHRTPASCANFPRWSRSSKRDSGTKKRSWNCSITSAGNAIILAALHRALPLVEDGDIALGRRLVAALLDLLSLHRICTDLALVTMPKVPPGRQGSHLAGALKRRDYFKPSR
jgi:hypothetical protein